MNLAVVDRTDVLLRGRLSAPAELRQLPGGDALLVFTLVVGRGDPRPRPRRSGALTCVSFAAPLQRRALTWAVLDVVEVQGSLQRRFWRTGAGTTTTYEVDCRRGRKLSRIAGRTAPRSA